MLKIAVMIRGLVDDADGIARHAIRLSRELVSMGHQVTVWAVEYDPERCQLADGLDVRALRKFQGPAFKPPGVPGLRMLAWLRSIYSAYRDQRALSRLVGAGFDVVNPHGNLIVWSAAECKRRSGVPIVWVCNDYWPPAEELAAVSSTSGQRAKGSLKHFITWPIRTYDRAAVHEVDGIAVLSEAVRVRMADHYGVSADVVRPGVDGDRLDRADGSWVKSHHRIHAKSFLLLTVCSFMPRRRLEDVIHAMHKLVADGKDVTYVIVGNVKHTPAYTRFILEEVAARRLERRVLVIGEVSESRLGGYFQACDAFIWPADDSQSYGMAATEAMACGKPIIVSRANGLAEIVEDGLNAFVVPPRSPEAIAEAVKRILSDPETARRIGGAGQQLIREGYTWRMTAEQVLGLFGRAIDRPQRAARAPVE